MVQFPEQGLILILFLQYLSIWFFREHGNKLEKQILLKIYTLSWRVRLSFHTRRNGVPQAQIYQGWKEFVKDNGLRRGDIVLFVFNVNVICFELHIFHALKN